jgi:hypothetical protein
MTEEKQKVTDADLEKVEVALRRAALRAEATSFLTPFSTALYKLRFIS